MKFEVSDMTWPGVLKKLDPVLSVLFTEGVLMTSMKLGSEKAFMIRCGNMNTLDRGKVKFYKPRSLLQACSWWEKAHRIGEQCKE